MKCFNSTCLYSRDEHGMTELRTIFNLCTSRPLIWPNLVHQECCPPLTCIVMNNSVIMGFIIAPFSEDLQLFKITVVDTSVKYRLICWWWVTYHLYVNSFWFVYLRKVKTIPIFYSKVQRLKASFTYISKLLYK